MGYNYMGHNYIGQGEPGQYVIESIRSFQRARACAYASLYSCRVNIELNKGALPRAYAHTHVYPDVHTQFYTHVNAQSILVLSRSMHVYMTIHMSLLVSKKSHALVYIHHYAPV